MDPHKAPSVLVAPSGNPQPHGSLAALMASVGPQPHKFPPGHLWGHPGSNSFLPLPQQGLSHPEVLDPMVAAHGRWRQP